MPYVLGHVLIYVYMIKLLVQEFVLSMFRSTVSYHPKLPLVSHLARWRPRALVKAIPAITFRTVFDLGCTICRSN
jgi:hypothetical protein